MKIIIIGKGPAGISAAIYAKRAGAEVTIIAKDYGALTKAKAVENYYGFVEPIKGLDLAVAGEKQAQAIGIDIINDEVVGLDYDEGLIVLTKNNRYPCDKLIMATGTRRAMPKIENYSKFEGKGISYCAKCDAYFMRGKDVAVIGSGEYALHEALELLPHVNRLYILTNGKQAETSFPSEIQLITDKISSLNGIDKLDRIIFANGIELAISGLFIAMHSAGSIDFLMKLGIRSEGRYIKVDTATMLTEVPDIYAVGDCIGGELQIAQAVYQGMVAALNATSDAK